MKPWHKTLLLTLALAALAFSARWWVPWLTSWVSANRQDIPLVDSLVTIVLGMATIGAAIWSWLGWRKREPLEIHADINIIQAPEGVTVNGDMNVTLIQVSEKLWQSWQKQPSMDLRQATEKYLQFLFDKHSFLSFKGLGVADRIPLRLPLVELFVPLKARLELPRGDTWQPELRLAGRKMAGEEKEAQGYSKPQPVLELLQKHAGLILLGDPGAGKTTFLKYLTVQMAVGNDQIPGLENRLPVLLPLAAYANAIKDQETTLDDFIAAYFCETCGSLPVKELLREVLKQGRALILLDGLDEVKDLGLRHTVIDRAINFYNFHRRVGNKFILTSRIIGYRDVQPAAEGLIEATLVDFADEEIEEFVTRWTAVIEKQAQGETNVARQDAHNERRELLDAVQRNPGVRRLAANPLLLTILALMKRQGVTLPERRVELYDQYVRILLSSWNRARSVTGRAVGHDLDVVQTTRILAPLALWMHAVNPGAGLVRREDLRRKLEEIYHQRGEADPETATNQLIEDVHEHAALLLERGPEEYGFIHLTFEEYLAGMAIALSAQQNIQPVVDALSRRLGDPAWREVSLLAISHLGIIQQRDQAAGAVVEALIDTQPGPPGEAVVLAGEAVLDARPAGVPKTSEARVIEALVQTMQSEAVPGTLRRRAGLALGRLGWQPDDLDEFVEIPAGKFLYGDEKKEWQIPFHYWIAKYPVTNSQFKRFIDADGYKREELWSKEGWKWLLKNERREPVYLQDVDLGNPIFPVVGVNWYEAQAYCRWLNGQMAEGGKVPKGYIVRLPNEEEWERAARGTDGHEYPWGEFQPDKANIQGERGGGNGTTAVCTYPGGISPARVWDMSGNVCEWTCSKTGDDIIYRGGSWLDLHRFARCAFRFRYIPDYFYGDIGFRPVLSTAVRPHGVADSGF